MKQLDNQALADYLDYSDGSSISHAISEGSISSDRFHRLLTDCYEHFELVDACEAPTAAFMYAITQIGKLDCNVGKRRFTRDVHGWMDYLLDNPTLLQCFFHNRKDDTSEAMFQEAVDSVRTQLKNVVVQAVEQKRRDKYPSFISRNLRTKNNVAFQWEDVRKVVWEWYPSFIVFEEVLKECQPS